MSLITKLNHVSTPTMHYTASGSVFETCSRIVAGTASWTVLVTSSEVGSRTGSRIVSWIVSWTVAWTAL